MMLHPFLNAIGQTSLTHEAAVVAGPQRLSSILHLFVLHKAIVPLDLHAHQPTLSHTD